MLLTPVTDHEERNHLEWYAIVAVLMFAVVPDAYRAIWSYVDGDPNQGTAAVSVFAMADFLVTRSLGVSALLAVVVCLSIRKWSHIGFISLRWQRDIMAGILVYFLGTVAYTAIAMAVEFLGFEMENFSGSLAGPSSRNDLTLIAIGSIANGFAEEVVIRGYLLTRFEKWLGSAWLAILLTSGLFASYHIYQGFGSMMGIFALGLVYSIAYCRIRSIWPLIIAHALTDYVALSLLP